MSIAYELASSEIGMILDCAVCNVVTARAADDYVERIGRICAEAFADVDANESDTIRELERSAVAYVAGQVDKYTKSPASEVDLDLGALLCASLPGVSRTARGYAVAACAAPVTAMTTRLTKSDHIRLKRIVEASGDENGAMTIMHDMCEVTASHVTYTFSSRSVTLLRQYMRGASGDKTVRALAKSLPGII